MYQVTYSDPQLSVFEARTSLVLDMAGQGAGKTLNIGVDTYYKIVEFPQVKGFIGANTHKQLSQTTISRCLETWKLLANWDEYSKANPTGAYVINKKPPAHFIVYHRLPNYQGTICFENGAVVFVGSLENYMAHDGKEFGWAHLDETKDTKKEAVTQVISARLRQYGFWYRPNEIGRPCFYDSTITPDQSREMGIVAFNPLYIHTSPSMGGVDWINELFGIDKHEKEIRIALADRYGYYHYVDEDVTVVIYQTYWNEKNLPPNYIQKRRRELTDNEQLLYIEGYPFSKTGAEYFPEFVRRKTVVPRIPFNFSDTFHISFDFNVVPYITLIIGQVDYVVKYYNEQTGKKKEYLEDGDVGFEMLEVMRIKIGKEMCLAPPNNETEKVCEELCDWLKNNDANCDVLTYGDASGKARIPGLGSLTNFKIINRIISQHYYSEEKVGKENISVLKRKNFLNRLFAGKYPEIEIYISEECEELIRDLEFLKQAPDGGKFKEKAKDPSTGKEYEKIGHCFVGETLITTNEGQKRIDQIKVGDFVLTRKGFKKVKNVFNNGIREVAEYEIKGRKLVCTDEHKVFTKNRGFVQSSQLTHSDKFVIFDEKESKWQNLQQKKAFFKSLTDLISVFIRPKSISKVGAKSMESRRRQPHTDTFGKRILAKFQKVFTFTTKTKTRQIIQSKILRLLTRNNILNFTTIKNEPTNYDAILSKTHVQKRLNGTNQKKVMNGTSSIQDERFLVTSENLFVRIVKMILKQISKRRNIVPQNAKSNLIIGRKRRYEQVFDIEVEEEHEYFANGVLVHNCSDALEYFICKLLFHYLKDI